MKNQIKIFSKLATKNENILFSPISFNSILAVLSEVAISDTKEKLKIFLEKDYKEFLKQFFTKKMNEEGNAFVFSNGLWFDEKYDLNQIAKDFMRYYNMDFIRSDFTSPRFISSSINYWVDDNTNHMIQQIVEEKDIKGSDSVLVNAVYFKSAWKDSLHRTRNIFHCINGDKNTNFIYGGADGYLENNHAIGFSKHYTNGMQFIGILSKSDISIEELNIEELLASKTYKYDVSIAMPVLDFGSDLQLNEFFPVLGLEDLLTGRNMTELYTDKTPFHLSNIMQNTKIKLDENGTEASAVTSAVILRNCAFMVKEQKEVILNKPFLFLIYDEKMQEIAFIGKVVSV